MIVASPSQCLCFLGLSLILLAGSMAACRNFFDEPTSSLRRSSSLSDRISISPPSEGRDHAGTHCLELTLGLGPPVGDSPVSPVGDSPASLPPQHDMVRPASVHPYLPKQPSGNFASSAPSITADASQTSFAQLDASKAPQAFIGHTDTSVLAKQRSGKFSSLASAGNGGLTISTFEGQASDAALAMKGLLSSGHGAFPSRDQIWQNLQKNGTLVEQNTQYPDEAPSMWSRRSASMQVMMPESDIGDVEIHHIRRSCSNGVLPYTLSRQLSNVESSLERSPQQNMVQSVPSQCHPLEALEDLQKRKEMQARRRQVARKRRKIFIEEKQHKKTRQSSSLQRGSRQIVPPDDKFSHVLTPSAEDDVVPESGCASADESTPSKPEIQGNLKKDMIVTQNLHFEDARQETQPVNMKEDKFNMLASSIVEIEGPFNNMHSKGGKLNIHTSGYGPNCSVPVKEGASKWASSERDSGSHGVVCSMMSSEFEQSSLGGKCVRGGKSLTPGTEYNHGNYCSPHVVTVATGQAGMCMTEDEVAKSCPSSVTECAEHSSIRNGISELECSGQKSALEFGGVGARVSSVYSTLGIASRSVGYPPFPLSPIPHALTGSACPLVTATIVGSFPPVPGARISKTSFASKDSVGEGSEGWGGRSKKSAFTPLQRTVSNSKHVMDERQCLDVRLESHVSFPASQLSSLTGVVSAASNNYLLLERQQSRHLGGRLLSQSSSIQDQCITRSKQERPVLGQRGVDVLHGTSTLRTGKPEAKQEEGAKPEEGSSESQLASEHSGVDVSYAQSGVVENRKSGSFPDLPWVTTTGKGPNGKTINGVMYIANGRHVRLVCSCHGKHMSPVEFVEHSGSTDLSNPERSIVVSPFPSVNHQLASTPV